MVASAEDRRHHVFGRPKATRSFVASQFWELQNYRGVLGIVSKNCPYVMLKIQNKVVLLSAFAIDLKSQIIIDWRR